MSERKKVIVIGGGPAGMMAAMAAMAAAEAGASVSLWDGNEKLGKKLYLTGKGRCNVTNACEWEDFFKNVPRNGRFLRSAYAAFDNLKLMALLEEMGVPLKVERGDRVFPVSDHASDITRAFSHRLSALGVEVRLGRRCEGIAAEDGVLRGVMVGGDVVPCDSVVLATGGLSYPSTGSTGDGYAFVRPLGHTIVEPVASLVPLITESGWSRALPGLSLRNVTLSAHVGGKRIFRQMGEMLFTHFGISGPLVLSLSAHLPNDIASARVTVDLKPALTQEQLSARIAREIEEAGAKSVLTVLRTLMPSALTKPFAEDILRIDPAMKASQITRAQRASLVDTLKALPLPVVGKRPVAEAVITRGGVDTREITPRTMESKLVRGLHIAGELLDIDGYTGGFNLQIAFTTGRAAGHWAAMSGEAED